MAQVLTSISGLQISAASAGFAPTNSADVSSIASSYAESAASGKLDATAQVVSATGSASATAGFWPPYTTSYLVSSINGSALLPYGYSTLAGNSANWNATRIAVTANSANWNSVYNTVSSNSASWSGSTGGGSVTSPSGTIVVNGSNIEGTNSAVLTASGEGFESVFFPQNTHLGPQVTMLRDGSVPGTGATLIMPMEKTAYTDFKVILSGNGENGWASASGTIPMGTLTASVPLEGITGAISASANEWFNLSAGTPLTAKKDGGILVTGVGELAWNSALTGVSSTVANNSASWGGGGAAFPAEINYGGNVRAVVTTGFQDATATRPTLFISSNPAYNSYPRMMLSENHETTGKSGAFLADAFEFYNDTGIKVFRAAPTGVSAVKFFLGSANVYGTNWILKSGSVSGGDRMSNWFLSKKIVSGDSDGVSWQYGTAEYKHLTSVYDTVTANSASWGGGGGDVYISGFGYNNTDISSIEGSALYDKSAHARITTVAERVTNISSDVSGTIDLVSSQSANWGGSALALSAGPGVTLTKSGNTLIAGIEGPRYNVETVAGYQNGDVVYQTIESGVFSSNTPTTVIGTHELYSGSRLAWIDVGQSYILYGNASNILPISWMLGTARLGSIGLIGGTRPCVFRGTDSSPTQCSAFIVVKYIK